jgi:hypothetical protein
MFGNEELLKLMGVEMKKRKKKKKKKKKAVAGWQWLRGSGRVAVAGWQKLTGLGSPGTAARAGWATWRPFSDATKNTKKTPPKHKK